MVKRNRLRNVRHQALFGADGAITAAATIAAAGINASATANAAKTQADAIQAQAKSQVDVINKQNENNNQLQEKSIEFTREQNELNRDLQKEVQMNLQLLTGQQNTNQMREAAKIQVKNGGSKRRLRSVNAASSLRGMNGNLPFTVTDGGGVIPIATTPEGYDLYEIVGNDHEHYHKANGGKAKTGVGIKFIDGQTIEGEGNQNGNLGELLLVTPNDAKFISRHTIKGFNPAKAVLAGVHPMNAFATQEAIKDANGISDDGKSGNRTPVRGMRAYGGIQTLPVSPDLSLDFLSPITTGILADTRNENVARNGRSLKKHGERKKAFLGLGNWWSSLNDTEKGNIAGSGWTAGGNIGGAIISNIGNNIASNYLTSAYNNAGNLLADAYGNLKGIDMNLLNRDDYRAAHAMAALQAPVVNTGAERTAAERTLHRNLARINRNTLSSAAAQNRSAGAEVDYNDRIAQIEANADRTRQDIIQRNMQRITDISQRNAELDTQANQQYATAYLNLLQYNNDIANERITGAAQAKADALMQIAGVEAGTRQANAASWAGAVRNSLGGFGDALATNAKMANEYNMTVLGASDESILGLIYGSNFSESNRSQARGIYERYKGSTNKERLRIANELKSKYNFE